MEDDLQAITEYLRLSEAIATAGRPSRAQLKGIAQAGFEVVINLGLADDGDSLGDEGNLVESLGLTYEHIPVVWNNPTGEDLHQFSRAMARHEGKKVFIHCAANRRVSVFMALFRILQEGWSRDDALRDLHQVWTPNDTWQAFIDSALEAGGES